MEKMQANKFSANGAASVVGGGKLLVKGHIANMFALLASNDWDVESFVASADSAIAGQMRADIRALKDCKETASQYVKSAVANAKKAGEFFAGIIARRDTYVNEIAMVNAAFLQAEAKGVTTGAALFRVIKGKTAFDVKPEKPVESPETILAKETAAIELAKQRPAVNLATLFGDSVGTVTQPEVPKSPVAAPVGTSLKERFAVVVAESDDSDWLNAMSAAIAARLLAIEAATQAEIAKEEKPAKRAKRA